MKTLPTIFKILFCCYFIFGSFFRLNSQNRPFPQQKSWSGCIKPDNVSQQQMNTSVQNMYNYWKSSFLKPTNLPGGYYIKGGCTGCSVPSKGTSEGHGYGMIITALMGGYDAQAKTYFDGLYKFFDTHRSTINSELMGWNVAVDERTNAFSSAADGDMDIAYALLLAHYQWGSGGAINYLQEAKDMINNGIKASLIHPSSLRVMMGDWDNNALETRSSDWMTAHFRAYQTATSDTYWSSVANKVYQMVDQLNTNNLGILPDFVDGNPASPDFNNATGEPNSQDYYWNACRTPLRIVTDFAHYGTQAARTQSNRFVNWAKTDIGTNFGTFASGYAVSGQVVGSRYGPAAFVAPLVAASITNSSNQSFLNTGWGYIKNKQEDYYGASINLLSMLVISGNWWIPEPGGSGNQQPIVSITSPANGSSYTTPANIQIQVNASDQDGTITKVEFYRNNTKIGQDTTAPYTYSWNNVTSGSYILTAKATDNDGASKTSTPVNITVNATSQQSPYGGTPWGIPGKIESENYDLGGQNVAFNDLSTANEGGSYRDDAVDIEPCSEGGYNLGWTKTGEWLEYTVNVTASKTYTLESRVAAIASGRRFHIEVDGQNVSGQINVPNTGGWQNWQTVTTTVSLSAGVQIMRVVMDSDDFNLNHMIFKDTVSNPTPTIENEFFDDFTYTGHSDPTMLGFGWNVVDGISGPTEGSMYKKEHIQFVNDIQLPGNKVMHVINKAAGTSASIQNARIESQKIFFEGTYAARVYFDSSPANNQDGNVETFYTINWAPDNPNYSELDFEYLPYNVWGDRTKKTMHTTSWARAGSISDNANTQINNDYQGWHDLVIQAADDQNVRYYLDGQLLSTHTTSSGGNSVYPRMIMQIAFANWIFFNDEIGLNPSSQQRTTTMKVDWVYHAKNVSLSPSEIANRVEAIRTSNLQRLNTMGGGTPTNQSPTITLTAPESGAVYTTGQTVNITANASDSDGNITKVDFLLDGNIIATDTSSPYTANWTATEGNHTLTARATDDDSASTTSSAINITVQTDTGGGNCNVPQYVDGAVYQTGDEVQNFDKKYECLVGGWCSIGGPYTPGGPDNWAWPYAWREIGNCTASIALIKEAAATLSTTCGIPQYVDGAAYQTGEEVQNNGVRYKCKVGGWCSLGGPYTPGGPDDWAWPSAWEDLGACNGDGTSPPTVMITAPGNNTDFTEGDMVTISANAIDPDGVVTAVAFYIDGNLIRQDTSMPYETTWTATTGNHTIAAIATDDSNQSTTSETVNITVQADTDGGENCDTDLYVNGNTYQTGDEVQNLGKKYRCKVGGWCTVGGAYTPGGPDDWAWPLAWEELGPCTGGNLPPEVTVLTPTIIYADALPVTVPLRARVTDSDGIQTPVYVNVPGGALPLLPQGDDIYQSDWSFSEYKTYTYTAQATDNKGEYTNFSFEITIKERIQGGDFLISRQEYNDLFPYRYGTDPGNPSQGPDPALDFFTYEALAEAVERMKNIEVTFERREGTNLYRLTRRDKATNQSAVIRTDTDFDAEWNQSKPIITQVVDYGKFVNESDETVRKRELAAFLANIAQETTGGWDTAPGGRYAWGLHFREEQGFEGTDRLGYRDEGNQNYPPAPGKSYHGRGPIQLSWNYNYGQVSEFLFGDKNVMLNNPEQVLQDGALAFQTAIWFWMTPQFPKPSAHDVMAGNWTPTAYDLERNRIPGFGMTVNIINGGLECGSGTENTKVTHRIGHYVKFTDILNVSNDLDGTDDCSECGCAQMQSFSGIEPEAIATILRTVVPTRKMNMYPNPFTNTVSITFELVQKEIVSVHVSDLIGNQFEKDIKNKTLGPGEHTFSWDTTKYPKGIYFYKVAIGKNIEVFKMVKQ